MGRRRARQTTSHRVGLPIIANENPFGFEEMDAYKACRAVRRRIYRLVKLLPAEERRALSQQMPGAAASLTGNVAEGYGRHHLQEAIQFSRHARGPLMELIDGINVCIDEAYADPQHLNELKATDVLDALRLLNGYLAYLQRRKDEKS